jgi:nitrogen fixation NifU-like protein
VKEEDIYRMIAETMPDRAEPTEPADILVSSEVRKRALNPSHLGDIPVPDGYAHVTGECGDSMEVFLDIQDRRIREARFDTLGCGFTLACGSMAMEMAEGKTIPEAMRIDAARIAKALGGLPDTHEHCAELAAETLHKSIQDFLFRGKESWKKLYRNR